MRLSILFALALMGQAPAQATQSSQQAPTAVSSQPQSETQTRPTQTGRTPAAPKAAIGGVVLSAATGDPIPNVRVTLARADATLPEGIASALTGNYLGGVTAGEITVSGQSLAEIEFSTALDAASAGAGLDGESLPFRTALKNLPPAQTMPDVREILVSATQGIAVVSAEPVKTDAQGRFAFPNIEAGSYRLIFSANGYARQDYGQRVSGSPGIRVVVSPGQRVDDLVTRMVPTAAVSGHITDSSGKPLAGIPVTLARVQYDRSGVKSRQTAASARTDDNGDYRLFYVTPGRYYLLVSGATNGNPYFAEAFGGGRSPVQENLASVYYPGVPDLASATPLELAPGADIGNVDVTLQRRPSYLVRGRLVDPRTGQPPRSANISLLSDQRNAAEILPQMIGPLGGANYNPATGTFEFREVPPGVYVVRAQLPPQPNPAPRPPAPAPAAAAEPGPPQRVVNPAIMAVVPIRVAASDVDVDVNFTIPVPGASFPGRFTLEAGTPSIPFNRFQVQLTNTAAPPPTPIAPDPQAPLFTNSANGRFRIDNMFPGEYRVIVSGLRDGYFVKSARFGDADVLNRPLQFTETGSRSLEIVISARVGRIEGIALNASRQRVPVAQVALIPNDPDKTTRFKSVFTDGDGAFSIPNITPGDYRLVAWETLDPFGYFDPEILQQTDRLGQTVRVAEASSQRVDVVPIPASQ